MVVFEESRWPLGAKVSFAKTFSLCCALLNFDGLCGKRMKFQKVGMGKNGKRVMDEDVEWGSAKCVSCKKDIVCTLKVKW
jgi:hypothetical protein